MAAKEVRPYPARFSMELWNRIEAAAEANGLDYMALIRRGVEKELKAIETQGVSALSLPIIHGIQCGNFREVPPDQSGRFELSADLVRQWGAIEGDLLIHVTGDSMLADGIAEEAIIHMRPFGVRLPRNNQICLITADLPEGRSLDTVKHWSWGGQSEIKITDADRNTIALPNRTVALRATSYWTGGVIALPKMN